MLLELGRPGALDGPVAAVVRPHGQLVHQQPARRLEQLDREHAGDPDPGRQGQPEALRGRGGGRGQARRRRQHLPADPVLLDGLHDRVHGRLAARRAGHEHGELALERDVLLHDQVDPVQPGQHLGRLIGPAADPDALSVVTAADRLEDHRPSRLVREAGDVVEAGGPGRPRARDAQLGQARAHGPLVLGVAQRVRPGADGQPGLLQGSQARPGHMLVIEGQDVAAAAEGEQVVQGPVVADLGSRADLRGAVVRRRGEHPEPDAEPHRGLGGHASQLAGSHHADHRGGPRARGPVKPDR